MPTADQAAAADPTLFDTDPLQPGEIQLHLWILYMWHHVEHPVLWVDPIT